MNQELLRDMREYSDTRILNTIKFSGTFSDEQVEVARVIALERDLATEESLVALSKVASLEKNAKEKIKDGVSATAVKAYLKEQGLPDDLVDMTYNNAKETVSAGKGGKGTSGAVSAVTVLIVIFFIIRIILRMMRDS